MKKTTKTVKEEPKPKTEAPKKGLCKTCKHFSDMHYGSEKNWCNLCACLELVQ